MPSLTLFSNVYTERKYLCNAETISSFPAHQLFVSSTYNADLSTAVAWRIFFSSILSFVCTVKLGNKNGLMRNKLVSSNHFPWPICHLYPRDKELALRNNFRVPLSAFHLFISGSFFSYWISLFSRIAVETSILLLIRFPNNQCRVFLSAWYLCQGLGIQQLRGTKFTQFWPSPPSSGQNRHFTYQSLTWL